MLDTEKIKFIDIEDQIDRDEIIQGYLRGGNTISKIPYKKAMEGADMRVHFAKQISLSAHTWTNLILEPYL